MVQLTREQRLSLRTDRPVVVIANAGSGKTRVLVERYFSLLMELGAEAIRSVVAITFTRAAAAEMFSRIAQRLEQMLADPAYQSQWEKLKYLRERLSGARISTIHSFAAQLLRDYAVEAALPPFFSELSEYESLKLKKDVLNDMLDYSIQNEDDPVGRALKQFFLYYTPSTGMEVLEMLLQSSEQFSQWYRAVSHSSVEELLSKRDQVLFHTLAQLLRRYCESAMVLLEKVVWSENGEKEATAHRNWITTVQEKELQENYAFWETLFQQWKSRHESLFTKQGTLRKKFISQPVSSSLLIPVQNAYEDAERLVQTFPNKHYDHQMFELLRSIFSFLAEVLQEAVKQKKEAGKLDFDDLQLLTLQVLEQHPAVVQELKKRIRYIMVDEFQDTNVVQYEIIRRLSAIDDPQNGANLFVVGDPKQSIYGFRGSDVRVFHTVQQEIQELNRAVEETQRLQFVQLKDEKVELRSAEEREGLVRLTASFRMVPRLAGFVNILCRRLFESGMSEYDVEYDELIPARSLFDHGSITMLCAVQPPLSDEESAEEEAIQEAELVAQFILKAVNGMPPLYCGEYRGEAEAEELRPIRYSDIAILLRARSGIENLTQVLRRYHIPFMVYAGVGFYQQPEIQDLRSFLLFVNNWRDDVSLAGILRSPFFELDDEDLLFLSRFPGDSLWEKMQEAVGQAVTGEKQKIVHAYTTLQEFLSLAPRLSLSLLLRTFVERSGWKGKIAAADRSDQMLANVEKLIQLAREYESRGFVSLYDFAEELLERAQFEQKEGEAELVAGKDVVRIMTIHAAKGQEFPCVILYNMNARTQGNHSQLFFPHSQFGGAIEWRKESPEGGWQKLSTPAVVLAKMEQEARETAEMKRLLYVALTRAQDHLVLSATLRQTKTGKIEKAQGLFSLLLEGLMVEAERIADGGAMFFEDQITVLRNGIMETKHIDIPVNIVKDREEEITLLSPQKTYHFPRISLIAPQTEITESFFSATQFNLFSQDVQKYARQYVLGLPETLPLFDVGSLPQPEEDEDREFGSIQGEIFHFLFEHLPQWYTPQGVDEDRLKSMISYAAKQFYRYVPAELQSKIFAMVNNVVETAFFKQYSAALLSAEMEKALWMPFEDDILTGRIDCVLRNSAGEVEIWDWKTDDLPSEVVVEDFAKKYEMQLLIYAYLVAHYYEQEHYITRLLFVQRASPKRLDTDWVYTKTYTKQHLESSVDILSTMHRQMRAEQGMV